MNIIIIALLLAISCDKKSDLLVEYVHSENLQNEILDGFAVDDSSKTDTVQRAVLDTLANDIYELGESKYQSNSNNFSRIIKN